MPKAALSDEMLRDLNPGDEVYDTTVPGLLVRRGAERCSYHVLYTSPEGVRRRPVIGHEGVATVAQARQIAREWLLTNLGGKDPLLERNARRAPKITVADVWARVREVTYFDTEGKRWHAEAVRLYEKHLESLAPRPVADLVYDDVAKIHHALRSTPTQANRVMSVASVIFDEAIRAGARPVGSNVVSLVRRYPEQARTRYADHAELGRLLDVLHTHLQFKGPYRRGTLFVLAMIVTGARPSELQAMPWPGPFSGTKNFWTYEIAGKEGVVRVVVPMWLVDLIVQCPMPAAMPPISHPGPFRDFNYQPYWEQVCEEAEVEALWLRDLRRTFASLAYDLGHGKDAVGDTLNHASLETTNIYAKISNAKRFGVVQAVNDLVTSRLEARPAALPGPETPTSTHAGERNPPDL